VAKQFPGAIAFLVCMWVAAVLLFLVPVVFVHDSLQQLKVELLQELSRGGIPRNVVLRPSVVAECQQMERDLPGGRSEAIAAVSGASSWIITPGAVLANVAAILLPIAAFIFGN
jgi:hypothetical protein